MNKETPLVSVFVPYYNDKGFLRDCIDSILNQTYQNFELILLNHASTDSSEEIAKSYSDERIKHIKMDTNFGAGCGLLMVEFLKLAKGKYAKLFCADDIMLPKCIETLVNYLKIHPEKDAVFGDMEYVDVQKTTLDTTWSKERPGFNFENDEMATLELLINGVGHIPYPSVLVKKEVLENSYIDKSFVMLIDMAIWVSILITAHKIAFLDKVLVQYRIHDEQTAGCKKHDVVMKRSFFESIKYADLFYSIKDVEIIKLICKNSPYLDKLNSGDAEFIPFVIAHFYLKSKRFSYELNGYLKMHDILSDDEMRNKIWSKFKFGVKEFRDIYSFDKNDDYDSLSDKKSIINSKQPKELNLFELIYLFCREVLNIVTLKHIKKRFRKKKEYTL